MSVCPYVEQKLATTSSGRYVWDVVDDDASHAFLASKLERAKGNLDRKPLKASTCT